MLVYNKKSLGEVSEWSKVTDSKSVVQLNLNRGFESLPLRQFKPKTIFGFGAM